MADWLAGVSPATIQKQVPAILTTRFNVLIHVRDEMADSQDEQKELVNAKRRSCIERFEVGDQVLLNT